MPRRFIEVVNARQNNLKGVSVSVPIGAVTAVTGVAGAGKSSLAFDVLYAEGHRRYAETFSPYARQFLERLDRPRAEKIEGVLPAVAVDRTAPVRTSRSTVEPPPAPGPRPGRGRRPLGVVGRRASMILVLTRNAARLLTC